MQVPNERPITWGDPIWDEAPMRVVSYEWYAGPLAAEGGHLALIKVDGLWRVVGGGMEWVS